ncbi:MAG: dihydrofolate reductase, partial [Odoribacter sp.]|nr:dihydrofolate reductase [Odoribacter sp.]
MEKEFVWQTEQFDDIKILRYRVPAFESLSSRERIFIYYLSRAALAGRDILWDQNNRHNLKVREALERIIRDYPGDRNSDEFRQFIVYAKKVFFANGVHHHYSMDKFRPAFSKAYFRDLLFAVGASELYAETERMVFDDGYMAKRVVLDEGTDLIRASANNYYVGVSQEEVERFYGDAGEVQVSRGLNSTLVKEDGRIFERVWKVGGLYG